MIRLHKLDLAREISIRNNTTLKEAENFMDTFTEVVTEALVKRENVRLANFGTWEVRKFSKRTGRNPKTGEQLEIPEFDYPAFKAGKHLKESIAGNKKKIKPKKSNLK